MVRSAEFDSSTGWTLGTGCSISGGVFHSNGTMYFLSQSPANMLANLQPRTEYVFEFEIRNCQGGTYFGILAFNELITYIAPDERHNGVHSIIVTTGDTVESGGLLFQDYAGAPFDLLYFKIKKTSSIPRGVATVSGTLTEAVMATSLIGASNGVSIVSGGLVSFKGDLYGEVGGVSEVSGVLYGKGDLYGEVGGVSEVSGVLYGKGVLRSLVEGVVLLDSTLGGIADLSGLSEGSTQSIGILLIGDSGGVIKGVSSGATLLIALLKGMCILQGSENNIIEFRTNGMLIGQRRKVPINSPIACELHGMSLI